MKLLTALIMTLRISSATLGNPVLNTGPPCALINSFLSDSHDSEASTEEEVDPELREAPVSSPSSPLLFGPPLTPAYLALKTTSNTKTWQCNGNPFPAQLPLTADWRCEGTGDLFDGKPLLVCYQIAGERQSQHDVNLIISLFIMFVLGISLTEAWDRWERRRIRSEIRVSTVDTHESPAIEANKNKERNATEL